MIKNCDSCGKESDLLHVKVSMDDENFYICPECMMAILNTLKTKELEHYE